MEDSVNAKLIKSCVRGINYFFKLAIGNTKRPVFINIDDYPELLELEKNFDVIRKEMVNVLSDSEGIPQFHEVDPLQQLISAEDNPIKKWKTFHLLCYGEKPKKNRERCPHTSAILDGIPSIKHAFFSILEGGKSIKPHCGPYCGIIRYHLALKVPKENPPSLRIKDQLYTWCEGKSVLFDDTWEHEVKNNSNDIRVVLFIDVVRGHLPTWLAWVNNVIINSLGSAYGKKIMSKLKWLQ